MKRFSARSKVAAAVALVVVGVGLWSFRVAHQPSLRLIFISATNDLATGISWAVFRVENTSTNHMSAASGFFEERTRMGWAKVAGNYDPRPGATTLHPPLLSPGRKLTFRTQVPSGEASYRLVLQVVPCIDIRDVGKPLPARTGVVYRVASLLSKFGLLPQKYQQTLLSNSRWLESKPFRISPPPAPIRPKEASPPADELDHEPLPVRL